MELSLSSDIDNILQWGEVIFETNSTVDLPEVSRLIDSGISKRQEDQMKHKFLEINILHKRENRFTMNSQKYHIT